MEAGGGATDMRITGTTLANRIIVAGAGGGAGYLYTISPYGGVGGGLNGGDGGAQTDSYAGGHGATQTAGGSMDNSLQTSLYFNGSLGVGANSNGWSWGGAGGRRRLLWRWFRIS